MERRRRVYNAGLSSLHRDHPDRKHVLACWNFLRSFNPWQKESQESKYLRFKPHLNLLVARYRARKISTEDFRNDLDIARQWWGLTSIFLEGKIFCTLRGKSRYHDVIRNIRDMSRERSRSRVRRSRSHHTRRRGHTRCRSRRRSHTRRRGHTRDRRSRCHSRSRSKRRCDHKKGHNNRRSCGHKISNESKLRTLRTAVIGQQTEHCSQRGHAKQTAHPKGLSPFSPSRHEDTAEQNESSKSNGSRPEDQAIDASKGGEHTDGSDSYSYYYSESEEQATATPVAAATATGTATAVRNQASNAAAAGSTSHSQSATSHSRTITDTAAAKDPVPISSSSDGSHSSSSQASGQSS